MKILANFYPAKKKTGNILGDASVTLRDEVLGDLTIKKIRVILGKDGEPFVSLPQSPYMKKDDSGKETGEKAYSPIVWASGDWKRQIDDAVLSEWSKSQAMASL